MSHDKTNIEQDIADLTELQDTLHQAEKKRTLEERLISLLSVYLAMLVIAHQV